MSKVAIGIIGCGTISDVYLRNFKEHIGNIEVAAVADLVEEKAQETAEKYSIPRACNVEELLRIPEIQIVVNLTVPAAHYSVNRKILEAGKHAYCEKPLTLNLEEAKELVKFAEEKGLMMVAAPDTFMGSGAQSVRALVDQDKIGSPVGFTANMTCAGHDLWHPNPAFYYKKGGGPMFDMGPYYLTSLVSIIGPIKRISAFTGSGRPIRNINGVDTETEVPTHYTGLLEFVNGAIGTMTMSFDTWKTNLPCLEIYGTKGSINVPDPNGYQGDITFFDGVKLKNIIDNYNEQPPVPVPPRLFAMVTQTPQCESIINPLYPVDADPRINMRGLGVSDMAQALLEDRESVLRADVSLHIVEALLAFEESANSGLPYEMTTTCKRPVPMRQGMKLWEV